MHNRTRADKLPTFFAKAVKNGFILGKALVISIKVNGHHMIFVFHNSNK